MYSATSLINVLLSWWLYVLWFFNCLLCIGSCRLQLLEWLVVGCLVCHK
jgi:hypothetical protein